MNTEEKLVMDDKSIYSAFVLLGCMGLCLVLVSSCRPGSRPPSTDVSGAVAVAQVEEGY